MRRISIKMMSLLSALFVSNPSLAAGPDLGLTDSMALIFGKPAVEPGSQGHMVSQWGYFEGPCMRSGDWALARTLPTDRFVQLNTHGPMMPHSLATMAAYANQVPSARFNVLTSCYGGNRWFFVGTPDASAIARMTGRPTIAFQGSVAIWEDSAGRTNVLVQKVPLLRFTRPPVERMMSVHYPDGRVKLVPHPERLLRGAILQPGKNQVTSSGGGRSLPLVLTNGQPVPPLYLSTCQKVDIVGSGVMRAIPPLIVTGAGVGGVYDAATNPEYDPSERIMVGGASTSAVGIGGSATLFVAGETATALGATGTGATLATGGTILGTGGLVAAAGTGGFAVGRTVDYATGNRISGSLATAGCAVFDTVGVIWRWKFDYGLTGAAYDGVGRNTSWTGF